MMHEERIHSHLFLTAGIIIVILGSIIAGCYMNLKTDLQTIKTVLVLQGVMPAELAKENK